jgi:hypothetical protein
MPNTEEFEHLLKNQNMLNLNGKKLWACQEPENDSPNHIDRHVFFLMPQDPLFNTV